MKRSIGFAVITSVLLLLFSTFASAECDSYCPVADHDCHAVWNMIHGTHAYDDAFCGNSIQNVSPQQGWCSNEWRTPGGALLSAHFLSCFGHICNGAGNIAYGGSLKPYQLECVDPNGQTPAAWGEYGRAGCSSSDGSGTTVSCNTSSGQLVYSTFQ